MSWIIFNRTQRRKKILRIVIRKGITCIKDRRMKRGKIKQKHHKQLKREQKRQEDLRVCEPSLIQHRCNSLVNNDVTHSNCLLQTKQKETQNPQI